MCLPAGAERIVFFTEADDNQYCSNNMLSFYLRKLVIPKKKPLSPTRQLKFAKQVFNRVTKNLIIN